MYKKKIGIGILAAAIIAGLSVVFASSGNVNVEKATACREDVEDFYTEEGILYSGKKYQILSEVSGSIQEMAAEENAKVHQGDLLLLIDSSDYERQKYIVDCTVAGYEAQLEENKISRIMMSSPKEYLEEVRQDLAAREAEYEAIKTVYEGSEILFASGDIAKVEWEQRKAEYQKSLLSLEQARSRYNESSRMFSQLQKSGISESQINDRFYESEEKQLMMLIEAQKAQAEQLEEKMEKCRITAPEDGIIREVPSKELSMVQAGQIVVSMTQTGQFTAEADVLTNIAPYLHEGDPVEIVLKLRGKDSSYSGYIRQVYDFAKQGTSSLGLDEYRVHVVVDLEEEQKENLMKDFPGIDGYGVNLTFRLFAQKDCITVPSSAVYSIGREYYVYRIINNRAVKQKVEITYQSSSTTVIQEGLDEGDEIVDQVNAEEIYDGVKVK